MSPMVLAIMAVASIQRLPKIRAFNILANSGRRRDALASSNANVV